MKTPILRDIISTNRFDTKHHKSVSQKELDRFVCQVKTLYTYVD